MCSQRDRIQYCIDIYPEEKNVEKLRYVNECFNPFLQCFILISDVCLVIGYELRLVSVRLCMLTTLWQRIIQLWKF